MVAQRTRARAPWRPHAGQRTLLADTGLVHEPDLDGLALCCRGQAGRHKAGEPVLKSACVSGLLFGCCGRTDKRRNASLRSSLPTVRVTGAKPRVNMI